MDVELSELTKQLYGVEKALKTFNQNFSSRNIHEEGVYGQGVSKYDNRLSTSFPKMESFTRAVGDIYGDNIAIAEVSSSLNVKKVKFQAFKILNDISNRKFGFLEFAQNNKFDTNLNNNASQNQFAPLTNYKNGYFFFLNNATILNTDLNNLVFETEFETNVSKFRAYMLETNSGNVDFRPTRTDRVLFNFIFMGY